MSQQIKQPPPAGAQLYDYKRLGCELRVVRQFQVLRRIFREPMKGDFHR